MEKRSILNSKIFKQIRIYAVFIAFWAIPALVFGQEKAEPDNGKAFDPKEAIFEHIGDSHSWHTFGKATIQLPVIVYTDKGLEVFMSGKFFNEKHEEVPYTGKNYTYLLEKDKVKVADAAGKVDESKKVYDFSITRNVASMWFGMILLLIIFFTVAGSYKKRSGKAPKGLQSFMEPLILFIRDDVAIPNIGIKYVRYMSLLLTVFFFILINNLLGLVPFFPGAYNLTGNIAVTLTLSFIILLVINFSGNKYYWKHIFAPDIPLWLYIIMVPVELIGIISKPFALMIRLFANITAGHIIVLSLISLIFIFKTLAVSPASVVFVVFMDCIELLVAFLQAYIFTMLSALFIGMAVQEHH
ncbi:F0F1 ATP synthase subunit A [Mucilaginibacter xinganensis]|uniref:ATP synthase subunit a n=1 Tax=Mucilaginibacter xinganensis TaxID=1234841 RepID=A0A223NSP5_9SPHI|nr:F0F1 ATP synthase subunit A [Mucilaginibacter xinganensis]ASU32857.1 ATP synthase F0 subcomplex A subunit [Mucilaginibacter xinganensis]